MAASDVSAAAIRPASLADWPQIWQIVRDVARAGTTFAYDANLTEQQAREDWMTPAPGRVVVASTPDAILGVANMYSNRPGPGAHIASGSLIVTQAARRRGVGNRLVADMVAWCRSQRFIAIQFNAVVDTNTDAIRLYERHGFITLGIAPGAFQHPHHGRVGLRIMWRDLTNIPQSQKYSSA